jgi:hypothetical protein
MQRDLEPGCTVRISEQAIGKPERRAIHCSTDRNTVALITMPTEILDGGQ